MGNTGGLRLAPMNHGFVGTFPWGGFAPQPPPGLRPRTPPGVPPRTPSGPSERLRRPKDAELTIDSWARRCRAARFGAFGPFYQPNPNPSLGSLLCLVRDLVGERLRRPKKIRVGACGEHPRIHLC